MRLFGFLAAVVFTAAVACLTQETATASDGGYALVDLVNGERTARGLDPLCVSPILTASAEFKSGDIAFGSETYGPYFAHTAPDGTTPEQLKQAFGYPADSPGWGENLVWSEPTPSAAFWSLWESEPHRANFLSPWFTEIGVGGPSDGEHYWGVWTMHFGSAGTCAAPPPAPIPSTDDFVGDAAVLTTLNLRAEAGTWSSVIAVMAAWTPVRVLDGPVRGEYAWYLVETPHGVGWAAGEYLSVGGGSFDPHGDAETLDWLNLREGPSLDAAAVSVMEPGTFVSFLGGVEAADGYTWYEVETPYGVGWCAIEYLRFL